LLTDRGRDADEQAVVAVINGVYKGFCFIDRNEEPPAIGELLSDMRNADTKDPSAAQIIYSWTEAGKCRKIDLQQ
ncbi:MAG: hypothetical protein ACKOCH_25220, partial [Bacteroidota bacterium]